ncbi:MAG: FecR family protein [Synechococcus sp. ELA057]
MLPALQPLLAPVQRHRLSLAIATGALTATASVLLVGSVRAGGPVPRVIEVPFIPAFVKPPGGSEIRARAGQILAPGSTLRTEKPGRIQVMLANGRQFRLGGDAVLRLGPGDLDLEKGQIIAWVNPGQKGGSPLRIRTRVATASIVGTTVFIDATADSLKMFSWEGHVRVETDTGRQVNLRSGEQLSYVNNAWQEPIRLSQPEAAARRGRSILLNGFETPMETLPVIERELGISAQPVSNPTAGPAPAAGAAPAAVPSTAPVSR